MAFGDVLGTPAQGHHTDSSPQTSLSLNLSQVATAGNLLIYAHFTGDANSIAPSGFSEAVALTDGGNGDQGAIYYKVAAGGEQNGIAAGSDNADEHIGILFEVEGPFDATPLDQTASAGPSSTNSRDTGTTGTTSQNDEFAVAIVTERGSWSAGSSFVSAWTNSFVERGDRTTVFKACACATLLLTATQTVSTTATLDQTGTAMGGVATFKKAVAATAELSGTVTGSIDEGDIVTGGKTAILTLTGDTFVPGTPVTPVIETADATESGDNATTPTTPWAVARPTLAAGDMLILLIGWDDSVNNTGVTIANGPNSEVWQQINSVVASASTEVRMTGYYVVATGSWGAGTISVTPDANEQWTASVLKVPAGEFDSSTPIGASSTSASAGTGDTTVNSPALTTGGTDGDGRMIWACTVDADPQSNLSAGWSAITNTDRGTVSLSVQSRDAAVTDSQSISAADGTRSIAGDSWCALGFIVRAPTTSPFEDARAAIRSGMDSAQSEGTGWDARLTNIVALGDVVRTSDTVCTITLSADASYDISAQETITVTIPGAALSSASPIVAAPTFTIAVDAGAQPDRRQLPRVVSQAVNRAASY